MLPDLDRKLVCILALLHIGVIALANYAVQFTATIGFFGSGVHFTWAMFVYPLVVLATDLTVRLSGQRNARAIVLIAYGPAIVISAYLADWRIGLASGSAYLLGQLLDIVVFQRIRARSRAWWPAPLVSTLAANTIDTYLFFAVAFHRSADAFMAANWVEVASVDLAFKMAISTLLFLPMYGILLSRLNLRLARAP